MKVLPLLNCEISELQKLTNHFGIGEDANVFSRMLGCLHSDLTSQSQFQLSSQIQIQEDLEKDIWL